jgi:hypothetical protein
VMKVLRLASRENIFSMRILRKCTGIISNFKSTRSLLSTLFVRAAKALLCENSIKLGGRWHK